jgi:hypothetical protein
MSADECSFHRSAIWRPARQAPEAAPQGSKVVQTLSRSPFHLKELGVQVSWNDLTIGQLWKIKIKDFAKQIRFACCLVSIELALSSVLVLFSAAPSWTRLKAKVLWRSTSLI